MSKIYRNDGSVWLYEKESENDPEPVFDEETLQGGLAQLITGDFTYGYDDIAWENLRVKTYREAGILTHDKGLVITLPDGSEYQVTIARRR